MTVRLRFVICPMPAVIRNASLNCGLCRPVFESRACRATIFSCVDSRVGSEYRETRPISLPLVVNFLLVPAMKHVRRFSHHQV
jgi:hypothetical protein